MQMSDETSLKTNGFTTSSLFEEVDNITSTR